MMFTFPWTRAALLTMAAVVLEPVAEAADGPQSSQESVVRETFGHFDQSEVWRVARASPVGRQKPDDGHGARVSVDPRHAQDACLVVSEMEAGSATGFGVYGLL